MPDNTDVAIKEHRVSAAAEMAARRLPITDRFITCNT